MDYLRIVLEVGSGLVLLYFLFLNTSYLVLSGIAYVAVQRHVSRSRLVDERMLFRYAAALKPISILAPAYNEELTVVESVRSLLNLSYPVYEVILVNDGSRDRTLEVLREALQLEPVPRAAVERLPTRPIRGAYRSPRHPNLLVLDKENGGKFDALNAGINHARYPLFLGIDTDSLVERDALLKLVQPYLERPETVAVGGVIRLVNGCTVVDGQVVDIRLPRNLWAQFQIIEYLRAFLFGRVGMAAMNLLIVISGAFGLFRRDAVVRVGGYRETVGEDMELVVRLHRDLLERGIPYRVGFVPDPVCWTEAPESLAVLGRQRNRWSRGLIESLWMHRRMLFNPRYGRIGLVAMPYFLLAEGIGAWIELAGFPVFLGSLYLSLLDDSFVLAFLAASLLYSSILSLSAVLLEELTTRRFPRLTTLLAICAMSLLEGLLYHPLSMWWRAVGVLDFLRGKKGWGRIQRIGFGRRAG